MEEQNKGSNIIALKEEIEDLDKQMTQLEQQKEITVLKRMEFERENKNYYLMPLKL